MANKNALNLNRSKVEQAIAMSLQEQQTDDREIDKALQTLEDYECWQPYFRILNKRISSDSQRRASDYIRLARVYYRHLEDPQKAGDSCFRMVRDLNASFATLRDEMILKIIDEDDYGTEAIFLEALLPALSERSDTIACLERLCLIYEKKKYDEQKLNNSYEKLVSIDSHNLKALRYFKVMYTQNQEWSRVIRVLRDLYENSRHVNDRFRLAQELATVYLYQLDEAQAAIEVIETLCIGSPLDTTTIHYEAFYRLENWQGCMKVLETYLSKLDHDVDRAVIFFKLGELEEMMGRNTQAIKRYQQSLSLAPQLLESLENIIEIQIGNDDWNGVQKSLEHLKNLVHKDHLRERVDEAIGRLKDGLQIKRS